MKKGLLVLVLLGMVLIGNLFGAVTTQTVNFSTYISGTIGPFNEWNNAGHILTNVNVELYVTSNNGYVIADNDDEFNSATISYQLGTAADLSTNASGPTLAITGGFDIWNAAATASALGITLPAGPNPSDWVTGDFSSAAPDGMIYNGLSQNDTDVADIGTTYISEYAGTGTFYFNLITQAITNVTFTAGAGEQAAQSADISGYVKVTYTDDDPLPVTLSSFTTYISNGIPTIVWSTEFEENNEGWNIYRGLSADAMANSQVIHVNPMLIPGAGNTTYMTNYQYSDSNPVVQGSTYWYWLESVEYNGITEVFSPSVLTVTGQESPGVPDNYGLNQNYPNPFNPSTTVSFVLDHDGFAEVTIYNVKGIKVKTIFSGIASKDETISTVWNGKDDSGNEVSSGIYFYKMTEGNFIETKRMILMK